MINYLLTSVLGICMVILGSGGGGGKATKTAGGSAKHGASVLDFTMKTIDGKPQPLSSYKGKVFMIVNTASECGNTPQYETLEKLYEMYKAKGFTILAFPANNFGQQEPGTNPEIKTFCTTKYHTTFDLFEKISVKGSDQHPLYKYITQESPFPGDVKWNFQKYLVDRSGRIAARYQPGVDPMTPEIRRKVEELLAQHAE
jgi:glutathione peroxidase